MIDTSAIQVESEDELPIELIKTFADTPKLTILKQGDRLFRFVQFNGKEAKYGAFWFDKRTMQEIFKKYNDRVLFKLNDYNAVFNATLSYKKVTIKGQIYNELAIAKCWNTLRYLLEVEVKKDIVAYVGKTSAQSFFQDKNLSKNSDLRKIVLEGGGKQYVIPRIGSLKVKSNYGEINQSYMRDIEFKLFDESSWFKRFVSGGSII